MPKAQLHGDWRTKVNPLFVLGIKGLGLLGQLVKHSQDEDIEKLALAMLAQSCREALPLLPPVPVKQAESQPGQTLEFEHVIDDPEARKLITEILAHLQSVRGELMKKGFDRPHWWMTAGRCPIGPGFDTWLSRTCLNMFSLMHFDVQFSELVSDVSSQDSTLFERLFSRRRKGAEQIAQSYASVLKDLSSDAERIVGRALVERGAPRMGHQANLEMALFFGWDFGLRDLTTQELARFVTDLGLTTISEDPQTLSKYRQRFRRRVLAAMKRQAVAAASGEDQFSTRLVQ